MFFSRSTVRLTIPPNTSPSAVSKLSRNTTTTDGTCCLVIRGSSAVFSSDTASLSSSLMPSHVTLDSSASSAAFASHRFFLKSMMILPLNFCGSSSLVLELVPGTSSSSAMTLVLLHLRHVLMLSTWWCA